MVVVRRALFMILVLVSGLSGIAPAGSEPLAGASRFVALGPVRVLDTRQVGKVPAGGSIDVQITGTGGVPASGVSAVALNVTATRTSGPGFLQVFPTGQATTS